MRFPPVSRWIFVFIRKKTGRAGLFPISNYFNSCSNASNSGAEKNSANVMSSPSQSFLIVTMDTSRRRTSSRLYTVDGVMPEIFANSFTLIFRSAQIAETLSATASFTAIRSPHGDCKKIYATAYTHLRIFRKCCILLSSRKQRSFRYGYYSQTALVNRSAETGKRPPAAKNGLPHHCRRTFNTPSGCKRLSLPYLTAAR